MCDFGLQIHPHKVEEEDRNILLIWDFELLETNLSHIFSTSCGPKIPSMQNKIYLMPLLDLVQVDCNCSNFPWQGNILLENVTQGATRQIQNLSLIFNKQS